MPHLSDVYVPPLSGTRADLLIGANSSALVPLEVRPSPSPELPYAERTALGWVVRGPVSTQVDGTDQCKASVHFIGTDALDASLERLWRTEFSDHLSSMKQGQSLEDKEALDKMKGTLTHDGKNYEMALPWRDVTPSLPYNRQMAFTRLEGLKRRLQKDESMKDAYVAQMDKYLDRGYATRGSKAPSSGPQWYLPHHAVTHAGKPGKVRIVFDGAAKYKGTSVNEQLLSGPDLINDLVGVLLRFRQHEVAVCADIEAMFMQIKVAHKDLGALRFLWWPDGDVEKDPEEFCMTRHVFGLTSSPSCAAYALKRTADDMAAGIAAAAVRAAQRDFYVDDLLTSVPTCAEAKSLVDDVKELVRRGGFNLTKWTSNRSQVVKHLHPDDLRSSSGLVPLYSPHERALGLQWRTDSDTFGFDAQLPDRPCTKRGILAAVASLFDPLGLEAPMTLRPKLLLQALFRDRVGWDDPVQPQYAQQWREWCMTLDDLRNLIFPRCYASGDSVAKRQLHLFCDASERGYGACAYLRTVIDDAVTTNLVMGKSRLAPLQQVTIPRLELAAAVVACQLRRQIMEHLDLQIDDVIMWTDSHIAIGYINNRKRRFKTYVANRLAIIHDHSNAHEWRHVPSKMNPADLASRGMEASDTEAVRFWQQGPSFLMRQEGEWPAKQFVQAVTPDDPEAKAEVFVAATDTSLTGAFQRFSSWHRLKKVFAWVLRFTNACRGNRCEGSLSVKEMNVAENKIVACVQLMHFSHEIVRLKGGLSVAPSSRLADLNPVMHEDVMVMKGRSPHGALQNWLPMILPQKDPVSALII